MANLAKISLWCLVICSLTLTIQCDDAVTSTEVKGEYYVEAMIFVDQTMVDYYQDRLDRYIAMVMNQVASLYERDALEILMKIAYAREVVRTTETFTIKKPGDNCQSMTETLINFHVWKEQQVLNRVFEEPDVAFFLSREEFCREKPGTSYSTGACTGMNNTAVIRDKGNTVGTVAHELGHLLGFQHDDFPACRLNYTKFSTGIMDALFYKKPATMWSECTNDDLYYFLSEGWGKCMEDYPSEKYVLLDNSKTFLSTNQYSLEEQCRNINGEYSNVDISWRESYDDNVCRELRCTLSSTSSWPTYWADYTSCAPKRLCYKGKCSLNSTLEPHDGQWTEWSPYGACSRPCGGGVQFSTRTCTSRYYGHQCQGESVQHQMCNMQECTDSTQNDFRIAQCNNAGRCETCKIIKETNFEGISIIEDNLIDGTICGYNISSRRCLQGKCECFDQGITPCEDIFLTSQTDNFSLKDHVETLWALPSGSLDVEIKASSRYPVFIGLKRREGDYVLPLEVRINDFQSTLDEMVIRFSYTYEHRYHRVKINIEGLIPCDMDVNVRTHSDKKVYGSLEYRYLPSSS